MNNTVKPLKTTVGYAPPVLSQRQVMQISNQYERTIAGYHMRQLENSEKLKQSETELYDVYNRLMFHIENAPLGFIEWDSRMNVQLWSARTKEILGWTWEEFVAMQKNGGSYIYKDDLARVSRITEQLISGAIEKNCLQCRNYTKDGRVIWCEWSNSVLRDREGKVITIMSLVQDITLRKKAEEDIRAMNENLECRVNERTAELVAANKALESFSYSASHDLRSPVHAILGFAEIIRKDYGKLFNDELKELFGYIESSGKRMNAIINHMLILTQNSKARLMMTPVNIEKMVHKIWNNLLLTLPHAATLRMGTLPEVVADSSMLEQVLVNLLSNAVKYSSKKDKPVVSVGYVRTKASTTFYVKDNGAGFDMKFYNRLFDPFQRLHRASDFEGTGVGLSLVKRIVERHGGAVWAESRVGEGAVFYFSLPQ